MNHHWWCHELAIHQGHSEVYTMTCQLIRVLLARTYSHKTLQVYNFTRIEWFLFSMEVR